MRVALHLGPICISKRHLNKILWARGPPVVQTKKETKKETCTADLILINQQTGSFHHKRLKTVTEPSY